MRLIVPSILSFRWLVVSLSLLAILSPMAFASGVMGTCSIEGGRAEAIASCCHHRTDSTDADAERKAGNAPSDHGCPANCFAICCHATALTPDRLALPAHLIQPRRAVSVDWLPMAADPADRQLPPPRA